MNCPKCGEKINTCDSEIISVDDFGCEIGFWCHGCGDVDADYDFKVKYTNNN